MRLITSIGGLSFIASIIGRSRAIIAHAPRLGATQQVRRRLGIDQQQGGPDGGPAAAKLVSDVTKRQTVPQLYLR